MRRLLSIEARNFRSLREVEVELGELNVLVGPNEAGKSNFLDLIRFLGDSARDDLAGALDARGGYGRVRFRGAHSTGGVSIRVKAAVTTHSSESAPDEYDLTFWSQRYLNQTVLRRNEEFMFKRTRGPGRRITVRGTKADFPDAQRSKSYSLRGDSLALSTLRRLPRDEGGEEIEKFAELFTTFRVFDIDVQQAAQPGRSTGQPLRPDASNLADALMALKRSDSYADFLDDARSMVPGLEGIEFEPVGGGAATFAVRLIESGLADPTYLADASFGTIRLLALLALLYDPDPPALTCIEEIDHGLHPYLFDRLVERLREAATRTQLLVVTHSPALVNRLRPEELVVVEREPDGSTRMPAITASEIEEMCAAADGFGLGELWFSGVLGGVPR